MLRGSHHQPWSPERARSGSASTLDRGLIVSSRHQEQAEAAGAGGGAEDSSDEAGGAGGGPRGSSVGQMQNLMTACDDLGKAMESLVVSVVYDSDDEEND